ncbi:MAG: peptidylprolyl isomerase [Solobacterium sp.]|nr:peptidylprolyl isomerase [Solobacterium sp.]
MNKMIKTLLAALMVTSLAGCGSSTSFTSSDSETETENTAAETSGEDDLIHDTVYVEMDIEDYGKVVLELDGSQAPITVTNFVNLVNSQFYDGLTFHRIMDGFMVQGGDPTGTGFGGSSQTIKGEFAQNGVENNISHKTGVISMARSSNMDSASSQFFICVADDEFLDGSYAAFGHVSEGLDVMMQIAKDAEPIDDNGTIPAENQPKINYMKVIEG